MRSQRKSSNQKVDIADLYALKLKALWEALKSEHISFWLLCFYYFFEYVRPQSLYPVLDVMPYSQILLLAALFTAFSDKSVHWVRDRQNFLVVLFFLIVLLSSLLAFKPVASWNNRNIMLGWFLIYFLTITIVNSERRLLLFLLAYFLFNFKMSQHGVLDWASRGFAFASYGLIGAPGYFRNSGEFAIQMLIFGSLALAFVIALKEYWGRYKKWFLYLAAATGYLAVVGASSRGSQLGLAIIGIWMLLKQKGGFKGLIAIIALSGILYLLLPDRQIERFTQMGTDENSILRLAHWEYALTDVIPEHPILGVGYANWYPYLYFKVPFGFGPVTIIQDSHNIYIQAAAELGITGLVVFLLLAINAFVTNARTRKLAKESNNRLFVNLSYGFDAGLIGYLVAGTFVTVLYYPFFWIQIAMIVMLNNVASKKFAQDQRMPIKGRGLSR
jgi:O-antigen ligase